MQEKGVAENEMFAWHHQLHGHEFGQTPGDDESREAWHAAAHRVPKSQAQLSDWAKFCGTYLGSTE